MAHKNLITESHEGLKYHWFTAIRGGTICARCDNVVSDAWLRDVDNMPLCSPCFDEASRNHERGI